MKKDGKQEAKPVRFSVAPVLKPPFLSVNGYCCMQRLHICPLSQWQCLQDCVLCTDPWLDSFYFNLFPICPSFLPSLISFTLEVCRLALLRYFLIYLIFTEEHLGCFQLSEGMSVSTPSVDGLCPIAWHNSVLWGRCFVPRSLVMTIFVDKA